LLATIYDIFKRVELHYKNANKQKEENSAVVAEGSFLIIEQEKKLTKKGLLYLVDTKVMRNYCFRSLLPLPDLKKRRDYLITGDEKFCLYC
jgi:hypothetical protein